MGEFGFTEVQESFRTEVRNFVKKELTPGVKDWAKTDSVPQELVKKMSDMGLMGINIPEEYGGQPGDWVSLGIAVEEVARADVCLANRMMQPYGAYLFLKQGSEALRQEWLPGVVSGDKIVAVCLTEPDCGSDATAMKAKATRENNHYVMNGEKTSVTFGTQCDAGLVFAKTDPAAGVKGMSCILLPFNLPGVITSHFPDMGLNPLGRASVIMDDVKVPVENLVGKEGKAFYMGMEGFDLFRIAVALWCLGAAKASLDEATEYAKQRIAFGRPIGKFEGVSFKLAEDATYLDAARLLCYRALWMQDNGMPTTKETAMCKWWCPIVAARITHNALLIHGHIGYSEEYAIEQRLRNLIGYEIGDGTAEIMKIVIARELMGKEYLPY